MIQRLFSKLIALIGIRNLLVFALLIASLGSAVYGISEAVRGLEPDLLWGIGIVGLLLGWYLSRWDLSPAWVPGLLLLFGVGITLAAVGHLWSPLWAFLRALDRAIYDWLQRSSGAQVDLNPLSISINEISAILRHLFAGLIAWMGSLFQGAPHFDAQSVSLVWSMVVWGAAGWAGWSLARWSQPLASLAPLGGILAAVMVLTWSPPGVMPLFLASILLLMGLMGNWLRLDRWKAQQFDYPDSAFVETTLVTVAISGVLVMLALVMPVISPRKIVRAASTFFESIEQGVREFSGSLGLDQRPAQSDYGWLSGVTAATMPRDHLLGSGPELSERVVLTAEIIAGLTDQDIQLPIYWRSTTYDRYTGLGWSSSATQVQSFRAGDQITETENPFRWMIQQEVRYPEQRQDFLYVAGDLISVDREFEVAWREKPGAENSSGDLLGAALQARTYSAQSSLPWVREAVLRDRAGPYPAWVQARYLGLPDALPPRVVDLAQRLIVDAGAEDAYDQALALETYLRSFPYNLDIPAPPGDRDVADYFLFDLQQGYCDYYATSMVVMARALGLPARLAIGYARGSYDDVNQRYVVSEADAHSWAEIYFPGVGWVPFEPTAGLPAIVRPADAAASGEPSAQSLGPLRISIWNRLGRWGRVLLWALTGSVVALVGWVWSDELRLRRATPEQGIQRIYRRLYRLGRRIMTPSRLVATPHEFSASLLDQIRDLAGSDDLQAVGGATRELTEIYTRLLYSPYAPTVGMQLRAIESWHRLRWKLRIVVIRNIFSHAKPQRRKRKE